MKETLVIGYGNSLRSDDGAGIAAVHRIAEKYPWVETLVCHQLGPELAETIASYQTVVFVDASVQETEPFLEALLLNSKSDNALHTFSPQWLLSLSKQLYEPELKYVFVLHIPAISVAFGEKRSARTEYCIDRGVEILRSVLTHSQEVLSA